MNKIILKDGKERAILSGHHWVFSGAVEKLCSFEEGDIVQVFSANGALLGEAYLTSSGSILAHMLSFGQKDAKSAILDKLKSAYTLRKKLFDSTKTNCYRLINAEGDSIPGLIIDVYEDVVVMQFANEGIKRLKDLIIEEVVQLLGARAILEKSSKLNLETKLLYGTSTNEIKIRENGISFFVDLEKGQKSGFFIDQREERKLVLELSKDRKVLNCFAYTGGFSLSALKGGAKNVISVESSGNCCNLIERNIGLNNLDAAKHKTVQEDVFAYLEKEKLDFDLIILDPPAFAKKYVDLKNALKGYQRLNQLAIKKTKKWSFILTFSCSAYVDEECFRKAIFQAALEANRSVRILSKHRLAFDHPISIYHKEGEYLKGFLLYVD